MLYIWVQVTKVAFKKMFHSNLPQLYPRSIPKSQHLGSWPMLDSARVMGKTPSKMINQGAQIDCDQPVTAILQLSTSLCSSEKPQQPVSQTTLSRQRWIFRHMRGCPFRHDGVPPVIIHFEYTIFPEMDKLLGAQPPR